MEISTAKYKLFKMENLEKKNEIAEINYSLDGLTDRLEMEEKEAVNLNIQQKKSFNPKSREGRCRKNK